MIERVTMLFYGHSSLIEGFNAFLPPGYHINASADPHDPSLITVTTPRGTMTSKIGSGTWSHETAATSQSASERIQPPSRRRKRKPQEPPHQMAKQSEPVRVSDTLFP
jgi:histone deacetylase complex regulatory component SIN3